MTCTNLKCFSPKSLEAISQQKCVDCLQEVCNIPHAQKEPLLQLKQQLTAWLTTRRFVICNLHIVCKCRWQRAPPMGGNGVKWGFVVPNGWKEEEVEKRKWQENG